MTVHLRHPRIGRRHRRDLAQARATVRQAARIAVEAPSSRERAEGGPEDHALYSCHCGFVFQAPVSTSVGCPHCGTAQAW